MIESYLKSNETNMKNNIYIYAIERMPMYTQQRPSEQKRQIECVREKNERQIEIEKMFT